MLKAFEHLAFVAYRRGAVGLRVEPLGKALELIALFLDNLLLLLQSLFLDPLLLFVRLVIAPKLGHLGAF